MCNRVANAMFAAIHLNNLLGTDTPREEVYLQCAMAFVLGAPTRLPALTTYKADRRVVHQGGTMLCASSGAAACGKRSSCTRSTIRSQ